MRKRKTALWALLCVPVLLLFLAAPAFAAEGGAAEAVEVDLSDRIIQCGGLGGAADAPEAGAARREYLAGYDRAAVMAHIKAALEQRQESIDVASFGVPEAEIGTVYFETVNDFPELFYVKGHIRYTRRDGVALAVYPEYDESYTRQDVARFNAAVGEALQCVNSQMSDVEKALALHDYLAAHIAYDEAKTRRNAYNALVERSCVCQGYALAYKLLLNRCGIESDYARSDAMNHIWNVVQVRGSWYHVDTTWDDPSPDIAGQANHNNFLRSDEGIRREDHRRWETPRACTDTSFDADMYWSVSRSPVFFRGAAAYYIDHELGVLALRPNRSSLSKKLLEGSAPDGKKWISWYSRLSAVGDTLFWNNADTVYAWVYASGAAPQALYRLGTGQSGQILGIHYENGRLEVMIQTGSSRSMQYIPVTAVPDPAPDPVPDEPQPDPAASGWQRTAGGWRYLADGAPLTGVRWIPAEQHRYIFDKNGCLLEPDSEGDLLVNGNLYCMNPERDPADPATCYVVHNYTRVRGKDKNGNDAGVTYYDGDGITFVGWIKDASGSMRYQTCVSKRDVPGAQKDIYIYVWRAQYLPACQHPDHPGDPAYNIPAGWYFFDDRGVLVTKAGWYDGHDGWRYQVNDSGQILDRR